MWFVDWYVYMQLVGAVKAVASENDLLRVQSIVCRLIRAAVPLRPCAAVL